MSKPPSMPPSEPPSEPSSESEVPLQPLPGVQSSLDQEAHDAAETRAGSLYAIGAYTLWGFFPVYWKFLQEFSAFEILAHRILWSFFFYWWLFAKRNPNRPSSWLKLYRNPELRNAVVAASVLLTGNWLLYIWSVNNGHILESSLGYFITPLLNVLMGWLILKEKLTPLRWTAVGLAAIGVLVLGIQAGRFPFISLGLAFSFGTYGLIRKRIRATVFEASTAETAVLLLPAIAVVLLFRLGGSTIGGLSAPPAGGTDWALFIGSGIITGLPLIWFAQAATRLPLSRLGFFQYVAPSIQFALGTLVYGEPLTSAKMYAFGFIWAALTIFMLEGRIRPRRGSS